MAKKKESYETMMERLEKIVEVMDSNEVTLEGTMVNYEEGVKLCNDLYKILNDTEGKIKILTDEGEKDFTPNVE
ncbi:exodeoxyribonuclease VII small subunit [Clostridium estertheticum]|uniref:Exodeoxyribonuclease 7 small subunit n=1 Tax=Clostridium estertheticum TaxID=238834 RepID=A0AA47EJC1_9CLOT|nr:exodeoxyribonuclease VII small subunit [Clostridium estertheticum]MBU3155234.1 exodeoxyribonuclease VII small subunit [Clostridium estertheticum]MBU3176328.1 exodeoxyribonuclease VII small subunit [Clostridium estertheticum]MBU3198641.1 exodeoxyribonuclease VII small subunit [Clostridium estertheticum]MBW9151862.1 exodeoxyribonuclease VII small subunit [Clostridium estertheticum]WAG61287.1 exodeoxyribonuclease VII small subunit [Clostridium estertheticum]